MQYFSKATVVKQTCLSVTFIHTLPVLLILCCVFLRLAYLLFAVLLQARLVGMIFLQGHLTKQSSATEVAHRTSQMMMMMMMVMSTSQNEQI
jgi:hypothetical protein